MNRTRPIYYNNAPYFLAKLQHIMCAVIFTKYYYHDHSQLRKCTLEIIPFAVCLTSDHTGSLWFYWHVYFQP